MAARIVPYGSPRNDLVDLRGQVAHLEQTTRYLEQQRIRLQTEETAADLALSRAEQTRDRIRNQLAQNGRTLSHENALLQQARAKLRNLERSGVV